MSMYVQIALCLEQFKNYGTLTNLGIGDCIIAIFLLQELKSVIIITATFQNFYLI